MPSKRGRSSASSAQQTLFSSPRWLESEYRTQGHEHIIGVDEAGRGPLAGPVVAAAAILPPDVELPQLNDSKKLSEAQRDALFPQVHSVAYAVGVGVVCASDIDQLNILQATKKAMKLAVDSVVRQLEHPADLILVDGNQTFPYDIEMLAIVKGDQRCQSIAAASIVAKVTRDRLMKAYDALYPDYLFSGHKGYPTAKHKALIAEHGPCPIHRMTFRGVRPEPPSTS